MDSDESSEERRAPIQRDPGWPNLGGRYGFRADPKGPGTIAWSEHLEIWEAYHRKWRGQSAEKIAERGGFGHEEVRMLLGREALTFRPFSEVRHGR